MVPMSLILTLPHQRWRRAPMTRGKNCGCRGQEIRLHRGCVKKWTCWVDSLACRSDLMARSYVARELVKLGGDPVYREGFVTDNGNIILDA